MKWRILREDEPGIFTPLVPEEIWDDGFAGDGSEWGDSESDKVTAHLETLEQTDEDLRCHAADWPIQEQFVQQRTFEVNFEDEVFFWGGSAKTLGDLTETAKGYTLTNVAWRGTDTTYLIEWEDDPDAPAATNLLGLDDVVGSNRIEFGVQVGGVLGVPRLFYNPSGVFYQANAFAGYRGRNRWVISVPQGSNPVSAINGEAVNTISGSVLGAPAVTRVSIGYRARFDDQEFSGTLHKVRAIDRVFTTEQLEKIAAYEGGFPYHLLGDSFLNSRTLLNEIKTDLQDLWRMPSQDGVGGTSLTQQAARFALTPRYWDSTLIIVDGGADGTSADAIAATHDMVDRLTHDRWLYVEPAHGTNQVEGSASRIALDAFVSAIEAEFPDNFLPTLAGMQALNDGSAGDLEDVNESNIWPRSLRSDEIHPNAAGHAALAGIISAEITDREW